MTHDMPERFLAFVLRCTNTRGLKNRQRSHMAACESYNDISNRINDLCRCLSYRKGVAWNNRAILIASYSHCFLRSLVQVRTLGPEVAAKSRPSSLSVEVWKLMESVRRNNRDAERSDDSSSQDTHENPTTNRMSAIHALLDNLIGVPATPEAQG